MPIEYYLGGFVAVVILVLLASMMLGKRSARKVATTDTIPTELTQQLTRIADSLEALLVQLKASSSQTLHPSLQAIPSPEQLQAPTPPETTPRAPVQELQLEKAAEPKAPEPAAAPAKSAEPSKHHVVLSMFGR